MSKALALPAPFIVASHMENIVGVSDCKVSENKSERHPQEIRTTTGFAINNDRGGPVGHELGRIGREFITAIGRARGLDSPINRHVNLGRTPHIQNNRFGSGVRLTDFVGCRHAKFMRPGRVRVVRGHNG
jgi:hypothetical protein